ncbi:MAG: hypothetical protein L0H03_17875 [Rhodococcus sp. (in: high G+C Gram-positive bacteria)]|nr:hypothetical protein [Rhodococcus sp. (in: high G+C Gram-positive bacteria)]
MPFEGSDPETADLARLALQPVLNSMYRKYGANGYGGHSQSEIEDALKHAGRGSFSREGIEIFARYLAAGQRPVLVDTSEEDRHGSPLPHHRRERSRYRHQALTPRDDY